MNYDTNIQSRRKTRTKRMGMVDVDEMRDK
jgi:hypothetical protein